MKAAERSVVQMVDDPPVGRLAALAMAVLTALALSTRADAADHVMHLVTEGERGRFEFEPPLLFIEPGDSVRFVPDDHMHGVKSVAGMLPEGAAPWRGRMGEELVVTLDRPGVYGVKCPAGYKVGMVGLIVVGHDPANWDLARSVRHPPEPSRAFAALFDAAACQLAQRTDCPE
jgi:pseudoazurin